MKLMQDPLHSVSLSTMLETFTNHFMLLQKLTLPIQVVIEVEIQKLFHQKVVQATFTLFGTQLPMSGPILPLSSADWSWYTTTEQTLASTYKVDKALLYD